MPPTALIIDDEADIRELIALSLDRIGLDTHTAANLAEARNLLQTYAFDVCLTDMKLPDGNGVEFVRHALALQPELPIAVITAHGNMQAAVEAMKNGAFDFVSKPVDLGLLRSLAEQALKLGGEQPAARNRSVRTTENPDVASDPPIQSHSSATDGRLTDSRSLHPTHIHHQPRAKDTAPVRLIGEERLVGDSAPMQALKTMIRRVARTNAPVWITGESGTGKELIAQLIHENGPRADAPFVAINCGAIPTELMESEMFGHRKGSFSGAVDNHDGLFKRAQGGTLFLDEVAELPTHMQVKLLRAIQERRIRPVGSSDEIGTNVRILSASHKDLGQEVDKGCFRHDLYYRLNVICIRAPALRQRCEDVPLIARHILHTISRSEGRSHHATLTAEAEVLLSNYAFPGNVRELQNILERAMALTDSPCIEASDLNLPSTINQRMTTAGFPSDDNASSNDCSERDLILEVLSQTRWNRKAAAKKLGLTYRQLRYRIRQYDIDGQQTGTDG